MSYASRRLATQDLAEEAVAEAFINAWLHRRRVPAESQVRCWLTRSTFHAVSNISQREARQRTVAKLMAREGSVADDQVWSQSLTDAQTRLMRALQQLKAEDQELVRLSTWEKFDHAQIGLVMDLSAGNVAVRLHRARARLRAYLVQDGKVNAPLGEQSGQPGGGGSP